MRKLNNKAPIVFYVSMVLLCAVLISAYMTNDLYASYATYAFGGDSARVAKFDVEYTAKNKNGKFIYYENGNTFVGSIVKIKESSTSWSGNSGNVTREYVGRGYVKLTKDGETTVVYADYADGNVVNNTRSLQYVAEAYRNDDASDYYILDYDFQVLVDKWAGSKK